MTITIIRTQVRLVLSRTTIRRVVVRSTGSRSSDFATSSCKSLSTCPHKPTIREQELALEFSDTGQWVLLGEVAEVRLSEFEREALQMLEEHGPMTPGEYAHITGRKQTSVKVQLSRMVSKNLITHRDGGYVLTVNGRP